MGEGIASVGGVRCGSRCLRREARGVSRERKFPGFTLIELLVVLAIKIRQRGAHVGAGEPGTKRSQKQYNRSSHQQNTYEKQHQNSCNWRQRLNRNKTGEQPSPAGT